VATPEGEEGVKQLCGVEGAVLLVQILHQGQQTACLTRLARGVEQEVFLLVDQPQDLVQVPALQGRQAVVVGGPDRTFGREKAHRIPPKRRRGRAGSGEHSTHGDAPPGPVVVATASSETSFAAAGLEQTAGAGLQTPSRAGVPSRRHFFHKVT